MIMVLFVKRSPRVSALRREMAWLMG